MDTPAQACAGSLTSRSGQRVRRSIVGWVQRRNAWTLQAAREHARLVPFIGIDPRMGEDGMLAELATCLLARLDSAITGLTIEHDMDIALELSPHVTVLHYGRIADGQRAEVRRDPQVREIYLGA